METSICGLSGVSEERFWHLGSTIRADKVALSAATLPINSLKKAALQCHPAGTEDYPEHGVIVGWHKDDKDKRLSQLQELVAAVSAVKKPPY